MLGGVAGRTVRFSLARVLGGGQGAAADQRGDAEAGLLDLYVDIPQGEQRGHALISFLRHPGGTLGPQPCAGVRKSSVQVPRPAWM